MYLVICMYMVYLVRYVVRYVLRCLGVYVFMYVGRGFFVMY